MRNWAKAMIDKYRRQFFSCALLLFVTSIPQTASGQIWKDKWEEAKKGLGDVVNNPAKTVGDIVNDVKEATVDTVTETLNVVTDPTKYRDLAKELSKADPSKLGQSLNGLSVDKVADALGAVENLATVAQSISDRRKLGEALDKLNPDQIASGLSGLGNDISATAKAVTNRGNLGKALDKLGPDQIAEGLSGLGNDITKTAVEIKNRANLGKALDKLGPDQIAKGLSGLGNDITKTAIEVKNRANLGKALNKLNPDQIAKGLSGLGNDITETASEIKNRANLGKALDRLGPDQIAKGLSGLGNDITKTAVEIKNRANLGKALDKLGPEQIAKGLSGLGNDITKTAIEVKNRANLGKALDKLNPDQIAKGLSGLGNDITKTAVEIKNRANLGKALDKLNPDQIAKGLTGLGDEISKTAKTIANRVKLGQALNRLSVDQIAEGLSELADDVGETVRNIANTEAVGNALEQLSEKVVAGALAKLQLQRIATVLEKISIDKIAGAIDELAKLPNRALEVLEATAKERLPELLAKVTPQTLNKLLGDLTDVEGLGKVLGALTLPQMSELSWEKIDQIKVPWKALDPQNVPWERVDPSRVRWEDIDPSVATKEAGRWFSERVDEGRAAADKARKDVSRELTKAVEDGKVAVEQLKSEVGDVPQHIEKKLKEGGRFVETQAQKLEQSVRAEVGRVVRQIKETPWYQEIQNFLTRFSRLTAYDMRSDLAMSLNMSNGSYHVEMDFVPGLTLTNQDLKTLLSGAIPVPNVDVVEAGAIAAQGVKLVQTSNDYDKKRSEFYRRFGSGNSYFASKRFVDWAAAETVANEGVKIVATFGYGTEDAILETEHQLMSELDELQAWLQQRLEKEKQSHMRAMLKGLMKCIITKQSPAELGIDLPDLSIRFVEVPYRYEIQTAGVTKLYEGLIKEVARLLGIDWAKYRRALQDRIDKLNLNSPHAGFGIAWVSKVDENAFIEGALARIENGQFQGQPMGEQFDLLAEILRELVSSNELPSELRKTLTKVLDHMDFAKLSASSAQHGLQNQFAKVLGFDPRSIDVQLNDDTPIVNLMGTPIRGRLEGLLSRLALGNEGGATLDRLEFNLGSMSFSAEASVRHRHVLRLEGLDQAFGTAWNQLRGQIGRWTASARRRFSPSAKRVLADVGVIDEAVRGEPKKLAPAISATLAIKDREAQSEVRKSESAVKAAKDRLDAEGKSLVDSREYLLWHLLEKPNPIEFQPREDLGRLDAVYYVNGALNSLSDAKQTSQRIADNLGRPVRLIYNPSFINGEKYALDPSLVPGETGTPDVGDDFAEGVYDRAWISLVSSYMNVAPEAIAPSVAGSKERKSLLTLLLAKKPTPEMARLQKNRTTRQLSHLLYYSDEPIVVVTHQQACAQMRNALFTNSLLQRTEQASGNVNWIACGSPLTDSETSPIPKEYSTLQSDADPLAKITAFEAEQTKNLFPLSKHLMRYYLPQLQSLLGSPDNVGSVNPQLPNVGSADRQHEQPSARSASSAEYFKSTAAAVVVRNTQLTGDFNGDGFSDLCFVRATSKGNMVFRHFEFRFNSADGLTADEISFQSGLFGGKPGNVIAGDFDGDGFTDLCLIRQAEGGKREGVFVCKRNDRLGSFNELYFFNHSVTKEFLLWDTSDVLVAHLNDDGMADLLSYDSQAGSYRTQLNLGAGRFSQPTLAEELPGSNVPTECKPVVADLNGDGMSDLLFARVYLVNRIISVPGRRRIRYQCQCFKEPERIVYFGSNLNGFSPVGTLVNLPPPSELNLVGDWNGDGVDDLAHLVPNRESIDGKTHFCLQWALNKHKAIASNSRPDLRFGNATGGSMVFVVTHGSQ
ncbi:FG-GAP-like repeat-containing protein [Roseiconus lacunae]|uniref:FG-GAP-like repeat-containing protein n=1 Tax=Roseiconus lacunae TaxID=2605694 RepID=UPI0011F16BA5|nr:FG-GAP-like repeat-containing protein [Roseiconus lacunae]